MARLAALLLLASVAGLLCGACHSVRLAPPRVTPQDLDRLAGPPWQGSLEYLDYSSGKHVELRAALRVERKPGTGLVWLLGISFPDEPGANGTSELVLSADGRELGGEAVLERSEVAGGILRIVTEAQGSDDDRPATLRHVYRLGAREASSQKLVRPQGAAEFLERNVYRWRR